MGEDACVALSLSSRSLLLGLPHPGRRKRPHPTSTPLPPYGDEDASKASSQACVALVTLPLRGSHLIKKRPVISVPNTKCFGNALHMTWIKLVRKGGLREPVHF